MDSTPVVDEVVVAKKNVLFEVTTLSKVLAGGLFIALPFIGGWIGYNLKTLNETASLNSTPVNFNDAQSNAGTTTVANYFSMFEEVFKLENTNWASSTITDFGKKIVIEYPENIPIMYDILESRGVSYNITNRSLPLKIDDLPSDTPIADMVLWATYTSDFKYLFYLKNSINHSALYLADVQAKQIKELQPIILFLTLHQ